MDIKDKYKILVTLLITGLLMFSGCHRHLDRWHTSDMSEILSNVVYGIRQRSGLFQYRQQTLHL